MTPHDARIAAPAPGELRDDVEELLPLIAPEGREPPRTMVVLARQPDLFGPFLNWAAALALHGVLSHRDHELLALRVASNCGSDFEWAEHTEYARGAGITDDEIAHVKGPLDGGAWTAHELALLRAADELGVDCDITEATWACLADHYEPPALVEILFVIGQYTMLSMVANASGIDAP
jgi:alkylhydroperoxidase family enzyme